MCFNWSIWPDLELCVQLVLRLRQVLRLVSQNPKSIKTMTNDYVLTIYDIIVILPRRLMNTGRAAVRERSCRRAKKKNPQV